VTTKSEGPTSGTTTWRYIPKDKYALDNQYFPNKCPTIRVTADMMLFTDVSEDHALAVYRI
jgi:hypothetical protein